MRALAPAAVVIAALACTGAPLISCARPGTALRHDDAIGRAQAWLARVEVDPIGGEKGKKHYVELLDAYRWLARGCRDRGGVECTPSRVFELARIANDERYHDMLDVSDSAFHQDATSYLRAAVLLEEFGVDVRAYREHVKATVPRLDAQMRLRGPSQQMVFAWYYEHFGLHEPFILAAAVDDGFMRRRADVTTLTKLERYDVTHEIFALTHYGELAAHDLDAHDLDAHHLHAHDLTAADRAWLSTSLPILLDDSIAAGDVDLAAEVTSCLVLTSAVDDDLAGNLDRAAAFLTRAQRDDGSFGGPATLDALHTTGVVVGALVLVDEARATLPRR